MTDATPPTTNNAMAWLTDGGEMGALIRAYDWDSTGLGTLDTWPQSLRTVTNMLLLSPVPIVLLWGEKGIMIYNDAYSVFAGGRHPQLLGSEVRQGWPEVADFNDNVMRVGLAGGTLAYKDQRLSLKRRGKLEPAWMNLDYSPVLDESGQPAGVIAVVVETTERVRAEERLRASEGRFRALVTATSDIVYRMDPTWTHMRELDGKGFIIDTTAPLRSWLEDYVPADERPLVQRAVDHALATRQFFEAEHRVIRVDGSVGWVQSRAVPVVDGNDQVEEWFGAASDISSRKAADQSLRENEARLRFLDALNEQTARSNDPDEILRVTTRMLGEHLGVAICAYADVEDDQDHFTIRGDWTLSGFPSIVGSYELHSFGDVAVESLRSGKPLILEDNLRELGPDVAAAYQALGVAATICIPLLREDRLAAMMAVHDRVPRKWTLSELALVDEVTERSWAHIGRARAEAAVREGERRFREQLEAKVTERTAALERSEANIRTIFETSHLYQGLLDADGTLLYMNNTALAGVDAQLDDVAGLPFWLTPWFTSTPGMSHAVEHMVRRVARGRTENKSVVLDLSTGSRSFDFSLRPVLNERGDVVAMVPEAVEKTARVKAEQALLQVQKMEALGNLTGGIAHDFNNLLMAVMGSLELLRERMPQDPLLLRLVDNARSGAERGVSLTRRMLAFARRQELKFERVDLRELVDGMTELMQRSLGATVSVETHFGDGLPAVNADANQLEAALLNLAVNARDAMDGAGIIVITTSEAWVHEGDTRLAPGHYVRLALSDNGAGMDEATLKRATEPFFTTKGVGKGTGLGLSMAHGLAEQCGGALILRSKPDEGTTAEIWLPADTSPAPSADVLPSLVAHASPRNTEATGYRVLLVDDDDLVRATTLEMLEDLGYHVVEARSGAEALQLLPGHHIDLVITDHAMPHMTGAQLTLQIRNRWPTLPVIMATGYADLPAGVQLDIPRLAKPYSQATLAEAMASALPARG